MSTPSQPSSGSGYNELMVDPQAAMIVLDHTPDEEEISEYALSHLDEFPADEAHASCEVMYESPEWLDLHERDQFDAHLRDGAECILVIYMMEGCDDDEDYNTL